MRVLCVESREYDLSKSIAGLTVVERAVPALLLVQVLVKICAATCNLSDLLFLQGKL